MALDSPDWGMTLTYWLHMLATVVWVGGLAALNILVLPAAGKALEPQPFADLLERIQRRLDPLGWFCLLVLVGTGMFQMSENPNYRGALAVQTTWAAAIFLKHLVILGMVLVSAWNTWGVLPAMRRSVLRLAQGKATSEVEMLQRRNGRLMQINLVLSLIVLALTALARVS
jgi:uncharacterized membrane protein